MKKALIIVDIQNDFAPWGALPVKEGDQVVPVINQLTKHPFDLIVATKDWHPSHHGSFATVHNKKPGEVVDLNGLDQILWPSHCVQHTKGSDFIETLDVLPINKIFYKGTDPSVDSYSAFFDNAHRKSTGLGDYLKERGITHVVIVGLATDYCVKYSVHDALDLGFDTTIVIDACRAVNLRPQDEKEALEEMQNRGAHLVRSNEIN